MKKNKKLILSIFILILIILSLIFILPNSKKLEKSLATIKKSFVSQTEKEIEKIDLSSTETYSVNLILEELDKSSNISLAGNKIKMSSNDDDLSFSYFTVSENTNVNTEADGVVQVPSDGIKVKIDGIKQGKSYDINIEQKSTIDNYSSTFKNAVIELNAQDKIVAKVKTITKNIQGQDSVVEGSDENIAVFIDEEDKQIDVSDNKNVKIEYVFSEGKQLSEEELEVADWQTYDNLQEIDIQKNGWLYSRSNYKDGEYSEISSKQINNIDKTNPKVEVTNVGLDDSRTDIEITVNLSDGDETTEYIKSGIYGYAVTTEDQAPEEYKTVSSKDDQTLKIKDNNIQASKTCYIWVKDRAGNVNHVSQYIGTAQVESSNKIYDNINQAIEMSDTTDKIRLLFNYILEEDDDDIVIPSNKSITFDLFGHEILSNKTTVIRNQGTMFFENSKDSGLIRMNTLSEDLDLMQIYGIYNEQDANLTVRSGDIQGTGVAIGNYGTCNFESGVLSSVKRGIFNSETGILTITGGEISAEDIGIGNQGRVTIDGGIINGDHLGIFNNPDSTLIMNTGKIVCSGDYGIRNNRGNCTINGGTIEGHYMGIKNEASSVLKITNGTIKIDGFDSIENNGEMTLENGSIEGNRNGILNSGTLTVKGGKITSSELSGINNLNGSAVIENVNIEGIYGITTIGTLTVKNGTISATTYYGIRNQSGNTNIEGGTIKGATYGIRNEENATTNIGKQDTNVNSNDIRVIGGIKGLYKVAGTINFYDGGIISPENTSIKNDVTNIEPGYEIRVYKMKELLIS